MKKTSLCLIFLLSFCQLGYGQSKEERIVKFDSLKAIGKLVEIEIKANKGYVQETFAGGNLGTLKKGNRVKGMLLYLGHHWMIEYEGAYGYILNGYVLETEEVIAHKAELEEQKRLKEEKRRQLRAAVEAEKEREKEEVEKRRQYELMQRRKIRDEYIRSMQVQDKFIVLERVITDDPNSADAVDVIIRADFLNEKVIKYAKITVEPYNAVGDKVMNVLPGQVSSLLSITGPLKVELGHQRFEWDNVWYNSTVMCAKVTRVELEYIDGTKGIYVKDLPMLFGEGFTNDCSYKG